MKANGKVVPYPVKMLLILDASDACVACTATFTTSTALIAA